MDLTRAAQLSPRNVTVVTVPVINFALHLGYELSFKYECVVFHTVCREQTKLNTAKLHLLSVLGER